MADDKLIVTSLAYGKSRQVVISIVLGVNYLTFEGGGGIGLFKIFFSHWPVVQTIFLGLYIHFSHRHSCCMIFFNCMKALQVFFFLKSSTPPQRSNGPPLISVFLGN